MNPASPSAADINYLDSTIKILKDWPKPGVDFRDIAPIFANPKALTIAADTFIAHYRDQDFSHIATVDARGFLLASIMAYTLNKPLILVRKKGKLPGPTISQDYDLEYGSQTLEVQIDCCKSGDNVLLFDDLIATGGSLDASAKLIQRQGASVMGAAAIIDLPALGGSAKLQSQNIDVFTLLQY